MTKYTMLLHILQSLYFEQEVREENYSNSLRTTDKPQQFIMP